VSEDGGVRKCEREREREREAACEDVCVSVCVCVCLCGVRACGWMETPGGCEICPSPYVKKSQAWKGTEMGDPGANSNSLSSV
jgi:hypothetical protein